MQFSLEQLHPKSFALLIKKKISESLLFTSCSPQLTHVRIAREHGVNANQVFSWRRLYQQGLLGVPALMRGQDGVIAHINLQLSMLRTDLTPYVLRAFFAFAPLTTKRNKSFLDHT